MKTIHILASLLLGLGTQHAMAQSAPKCEEHPKTEWRSDAELKEKLTQEGWKVRRIDEGCTCYEVFATTPDNKRVAAYFDPKTLEQVGDE